MTGIFLTFISAISAIITTNIIMTKLGSEINGIHQTANQFVNMFSLIEGGFVLSAVVSLYEPMRLKNQERINVIYSTVSSYLKKVAIVFAALSTIASLIYTLNIKSNVDKLTIFLVFLLSISNSLCIIAVQLRNSVIFESTQTEYKLKTLNSVCSIGVMISIYITSTFFNTNIIVIKSIILLGTMINVFLISLKRRYAFPKIKKIDIIDKGVVKGSGDIFIQKIAATVNQSLDMVVLTGMTLAVYSSIYAIYNMLFNFGRMVIDSVSLAPFNGLGQIYSKGSKDEIKKAYKLYEFDIIFISSVIITSVAIIAIPFINIYTRNVKDANYVDSKVALLFAIVIMLNCINKPSGAMINLSGNFKLQKITTTISTIINLVLSLILAPIYNIKGVLIATLISYLVLVPANIYYNCTKVTETKIIDSIKVMSINFALFSILTVVGVNINFDHGSYMKIFGLGCIISMVVLIIFIIINTLLFSSMMKENANIIKKIFLKIQTKES